MSTIILDLSSGNTCHNDKTIVKQMIDVIKAIDAGKHKIILKFQLFIDDGINIPLEHEIFDYAYKYGNEQGYKVTSSVADLESLKFLLQYDVPFVKIPNDRKLDWLIGEVPRKILVYVSYAEFLRDVFIHENQRSLICVSEYPATIEQYKKVFGSNPFAIQCNGFHGISDHTINFGLWYKYEPEIIEWHFKLEDSTGFDAGEFARTPAMLKEII